MSKQYDSKDDSKKQGEQTFSILPHPARTNNPADLTNHEEMPSAGERMSQLASGGPQILSDEQKSGLEAPLTREELRRRAAELNK